ncbi:MAG TPA: hypothetical protein VFT72_18855 [Opitutaceae bacterium]|nr:hypothetical protein [Opitutaceae bacterium]
MKLLRLICVVSLFANIALAATLLYQQKQSASATAAHVETNQPKPIALTPEEQAHAAAVTKLTTALKNNDPAAVRDQLRALGFADDVVRSMVRAIVYRPVLNLQKSFSTAQHSGNSYLSMQPGMFSFANLTAQQREQFFNATHQADRELEALLGPDPLDARQNRYSFLGAEKAAKLRSLDADYDELRNKLMLETNGFRVPADDEKMAYIESERRKDIAALLTPEEMQEYELRTSPTANRVRGELRNFDATEAEYKAIYAAQKALDDRAKASGTGTPVNGQSFSDAQQAMNDQIRAALGDERYNEYMRSHNPDYQALNAAARRFNLPTTAVDQAFTTRDQTIASAQRITSDPTMNDDQRRAALNNLVTQTRNQLRTTLGQEAADAYMRSNMRWLDDAQRGAAITVNPNGMVSTRRPAPNRFTPSLTLPNG